MGCIGKREIQFYVEYLKIAVIRFNMKRNKYSSKIGLIVKLFAHTSSTVPDSFHSWCKLI